MKNIVVAIPNEEVSRKIQGLAFARGFKWVSGEVSATSFNVPFLYFHGVKTIGHGIDAEYALCKIADGNTVSVCCLELLRNPDKYLGPIKEKPILTLDGVEYSESTLRSLIKKATGGL